jgi:4-amino-4-deoxy-L-arabinose transferase-like glycosyltransferase
MAQLTRSLPRATGGDLSGAELTGAIHRVRVQSLALPVLVLLAGVLYLANLTVSGWANTYYALAAQAASQSWSALFFGSLDASSFVTLDKPPLAILPMALAVKVLGLSSFSILLPEALLGIGTVAVLYLAVRRSFGVPAAFLAGLTAALTPVAVLIFRYDNPDALLTFLLVTAAWALGRGLEAGRLRWALLAAALVGLGFLTKYLQAYLVLPAFALTWLLCAPVSLPRRVAGLVTTAITVLAASGWWVAIVELIPASARPYIGGSTNNSVLDLIFGYDGLGRIFGNNPGGTAPVGAIGGGGPDGAGLGFGGLGFGGVPGLLRLLNDQFAGQIGWLLPAALLGLGVGLMLYRRAPRTDRRLAGYLLWGGVLLAQVAVFSFMSGIVHAYYTVVLAPPIAALVGAASWDLWRRREVSPAARLTLAAGVVASGLVAYLLLDRTPAFVPGLGFGIVALAGAAAVVLVIPGLLVDRRILRGAIVLALIAVLAGPTAYSVATIAQAHSGGDVAAGPAGDGQAGNAAVTGDPALVQYLLAHRGSARWIVAVDGSEAAADIQLAAQQAVMSMGGFNGSDATPTLEQLKAYVASGELRYVLVGGRGLGGPAGFGTPGRFGAGAPGGPAATGAAISSWVTSTCTPLTLDGIAGNRLYDCAGAA